jgi:hypothetical protein
MVWEIRGTGNDTVPDLLTRDLQRGELGWFCYDLHQSPPFWIVTPLKDKELHSGTASPQEGKENPIQIVDGGTVLHFGSPFDRDRSTYQ